MCWVSNFQRCLSWLYPQPISIELSLECGFFLEAKIFALRRIGTWARKERRIAHLIHVTSRCLETWKESTSASRWKATKWTTWLTRKMASFTSLNSLTSLFVFIEFSKTTKGGGNFEVNLVVSICNNHGYDLLLSISC